MSVQIAQAVMENCGLYNGSSTSKNAQMKTQIAQTVIGNGDLYNGNSISRNTKMNTQMTSGGDCLRGRYREPTPLRNQ